MKLLPVNTKTRVNTGDSLGHGMDAVIMLAIFLLGGYGLDRLFGTIPIFMIVMTVIGSVGLFYKFKASYSARMDELEAQRRGPAATKAAADAAAAASALGSDPEAAA
jgi:F0F1-type ATP synthase assembly protein I